MHARRSRFLEAQVRAELAVLGQAGRLSAEPTPRGGLGGGFRFHQGRRKEVVPIRAGVLRELDTESETPCVGRHAKLKMSRQQASVRRPRIISSVTIETVLEARRQQQKPPAAMRLAPLHNPPPLSADCTAPRHKGGCGAATACCADNSVQLMNSVEQKTPHSKDGSILAANASNFLSEVDAAYSNLVLSARTSWPSHQPLGGVTVDTLLRIS